MLSPPLPGQASAVRLRAQRGQCRGGSAAGGWAQSARAEASASPAATSGRARSGRPDGKAEAQRRVGETAILNKPTNKAKKPRFKKRR
jgi:hypothetical protein